ncbi:LAMI_0C03510g1_1 [Lachancea mirantina]|uniref:LAMI_0C03510g1_1 n=1 Tax=Lachancea mirantina TaxID=1230905 RepID=A0A1G4J1J6_9SACH|nr:LAMI_0C03510g1_1 [Lachancea mirantina]
MTEVVTISGKQVLKRSDQDEKDGFSFLSIVESVDKLSMDYFSDEHFLENVYSLKTHDGTQIGFVLKCVIKEFLSCAKNEFDQVFRLLESDKALQFLSEDYDQRNCQLNQLALQLREKSSFECLKGWRNEFYTVFEKDKRKYVLVERAIAGLLGIVTYGVHINGFVKDRETGDLKFWVPRRSATKATWPSMLDNTIAGGLGHPHGIYETIFKEGMEEAHLPREIIQNYLVAVGAVTYFYFQGDDKFTSESSLVTGEVEYLFDLQLPENVIPRPHDDEVESFQLLTLQEVVTSIRRLAFKPNCALVLVEFLIRHGFITAENEPNYLVILNRIHRNLPLPLMG